MIASTKLFGSETISSRLDDRHGSEEVESLFQGNVRLT